MKAKNKPAFTRKFIIAISVIYSLLVIGVAVFFSLTVRENGRIIEDTLVSESNDIQLLKTSLLTKNVLLEEISSPRHLPARIKKACEGYTDILHVLVFSRTRDENYFRLVESVPVNSYIVPEIKRGDIVQDTQGLAYLKTGRLHDVIDPNIYKKAGYTWQNTYHPLEIKNKTYILQYIVSSTLQDRIEQAFFQANHESTKRLAIMTAVLVLAVIILTVLFFQNYSYLVTRLADYMQQAAGGNLDLNLNPVSDSELNELALSFNTLIEEMRGMRETRPRAETADTPPPAVEPEDQSIKTIFNQGVASLKDNRLDEAITLFRALLLVKAGNFGCYFNLGVAYAKSKRYEDSLDMFLKAREANPAYAMTENYIERVEKILLHNAPAREN